MKSTNNSGKAGIISVTFQYVLVLMLPLLFIAHSAVSQNNKPVNNNKVATKAVHSQLLQFSGMVVDKQSLQPIPFTAIMIRTNGYGTVCDNNGYFSFVAQPLDTIEFVAIGYKTNTYLVIPDTITDRYALIHLMERDTTALKTVTVYPWPAREEFRDAFLSLNLHDVNMERAKRNLALAQQKARIAGIPMDGEANYMYAMQEENNKLYYGGELPLNNLLNPFAWSKFIKALKSGSLNIQ